MGSEISRYMNYLLVALLMPMALVNGMQAPQNLPGLVVEEVSANSLAAKAGLKVGDRILTYDEKALASPATLQAAVDNTIGKKEVVLEVRRAEQRLTLTVPLGLLGINVRPELSPTALQLYEEGRAAMQAQRVKEAIDRWEGAAKAAGEMGDQMAAAWLRKRVGEAYEGQKQWKEGI